MTVAATQVSEKIKTVLNQDNALFIIDSNGIIVGEKNGSKVKVKGYMEPEQLIKCLTANIPFNTGIIPRDTVYYQKISPPKGGATHIFILELNPKVYHLNQQYRVKRPDGTYGDKVYKTFKVALPYVQFVFIINEFQPGLFTHQDIGNAFCTQKPIASLTDPLFALPLQNVTSSNGAICWGDAAVRQDKTDNLASYVRKSINNFFTAPFTDHYTVPWPKDLMAPNLVQSSQDMKYNPEPNFLEWERKTKDDPSFILKIPLTPSGQNLSNLLQIYTGKQ